LRAETRNRNRDARREQQSHRDQNSEVGVELAEVDLKRGIRERQATAYNHNAEEWPEEFIFHGAGDDMKIMPG